MLYRLLHALLLPVFLRRIGRLDGLEHVPDRSGFILAANHIDYLDGFFISAALGRNRPRMVQFLSETKNYWWAGSVTIPVDRQNKAASLDQALSALQKGSIICLFVEGRRNPTATLLPGRTGTARLAAWTGLPVIPVGLRGPSARNFLASVVTMLRGRHPITLRFGEPILLPRRNPADLTKTDLVDITRTIMEGVARAAEKTFYPSSIPQ